MKTRLKKTCLALVAFFLLTGNHLQAQEITPESKTTLSVETDPVTFLFKGYALHIRIKPKNSKRLAVGAGLYALDMPSFLVNMNKENRNKGWNVRIHHAVSLFGEYYLGEANNKWFVGLQAGIQNFTNTNDLNPGEKSSYNNLLIMPSIGYNWRPFQKIGLYIKPWLGIGYTTRISGNNSINTQKYSIAPVTNFVTLHVGYTF